jgi:hypothetical protein
MIETKQEAEKYPNQIARTVEQEAFWSDRSTQLSLAAPKRRSRLKNQAASGSPSRNAFFLPQPTRGREHLRNDASDKLAAAQRARVFG